MHRAEIGAHLHPWSTPPFQEMSLREPVPPEQLPTPILREKFANLVAEVWRSLGVKPTSFRAGRFDVGPKALGLLPEFGFKVDSSVAPLTLKGGDDYFLAPADPFRLTQQPPGKPPLLEAPLTLVPLISLLPRALARLAPRLSLSAGRRLLSCFQYLGAAGIQPAWFSLPSMRLAAALHRSRGGRVLTMFFHSTELIPGGNRLFPSEAAVAGFVGKIRDLPELAGQERPGGGCNSLRALSRVGCRPIAPRLPGMLAVIGTLAQAPAMAGEYAGVG